MFAHLARQGTHPRTAALKAGTRLRRLAAALTAVTVGLLASAATIPAAFARDVPRPTAWISSSAASGRYSRRPPPRPHRHAGLADHADRPRCRAGRGRRHHRPDPGTGRPPGRPVASRLDARPARLVRHTIGEPRSQQQARRGPGRPGRRPGPWAHTPPSSRYQAKRRLAQAAKTPGQSTQEKTMFMNPYIGRELARERQRDMLTHARNQRLARQLRTESGAPQRREQPWPRLRHALRAAAGLRAVPQT